MLSAFITALTCWLGAFMEADAAKECRSIQTAEPSKGLMGPFFPHVSCDQNTESIWSI